MPVSKMAKIAAKFLDTWNHKPTALGCLSAFFKVPTDHHTLGLALRLAVGGATLLGPGNRCCVFHDPVLSFVATSQVIHFPFDRHV